MATITSAGSGLWSATGTWVGAVVPVEGDKVIIAATHVVTVDGTYTCGDDSVTATIGSAALNISGTLKASRTVSSSMTVKGLIYCDYATQAIDYGTVADPIPLAYTATLLLNKATTAATRMGLQQRAHASGAGNFISWSFVGDNTRLRGVTLAADATTGSANITLSSSSHNWQVNDTVLLFPASGGTSILDEAEFRTVSSIAGAVITLNAAPTYLHKSGAVVGNMTANVKLRSFNEVSGQAANIQIEQFISGTAPTLGLSYIFRDVEFGVWGSGGQNTGFTINGNGTTTQSLQITRCTYRNSATSAGILNQNSGITEPLPISDCVVYSPIFTYGAAKIEASNCYFAISSQLAALGSYPTTFTNCWIAGKTSGAGPLSVPSASSFLNCTFSGFGTSFISSTPREVLVESSDLGATYGWGAFSGDRAIRFSGTTYAVADLTLKNCVHPALFTPIATTKSELAAQSYVFSIQYLNKNNDVTLQELYTRGGYTYADTTNKKSSTSSISLSPSTTAFGLTRTLSIPCANGGTIRIVGWVKKSHATNIGATVAVTGLGSSVSPFTKASDTSWEKYDLSATNSSGIDGSFTLTYTATAVVGITESVYFDGVPDSPFVTKARHYGFTFDEANPVRTVNGTIQQATEATAIAYTGISIAGTTTLSPTTLTASKVFQDVYDYSQAYACANLTYTPSFTATGSPGTPALIALANVTTTGFTLDGGGSLAMGAYTLTANSPWAYTFTGGTFSQAAGSGLPVYSGGTLTLSSTGTRTLQMTGGQITFSAAGTYNMAASTLAGSVNLVNTSGSPVTVQVAAGQSYTNTGPSITISAPVNYQTVTLTGVLAGSRVQIYDTTNSVELFNGTSGYSWTDSVDASISGSRVIRVRVAYVSGATAKAFIEATAGTCGTGTGNSAVTYPIVQTNDNTYIDNGVTGSGVTGITFTDAATDLVNCNIAGGSVGWPSIYAAFVYWNFTATGIANDFTYVSAPDTANYLLSGMKIRNTSAMDLSVISGYGRDATTKASKDIIDTAGSTGNIFLAPDHVVAYQTSGSYAITGDIATVLTAVGNVPTGVRTELTTELARIDVATSTRLSTAGYTAPTTPPTAAAISAQVLADAATTPIAAEIKKINGVTLQGAGTTLDPMRPV
jgi:hypothetical protein